MIVRNRSTIYLGFPVGVASALLLAFFCILPDTVVAGPDAPNATVLNPGDIAMIGVGADDPDNFAFVPLVNIEAGTEIRFTDSGWLSTDSFRGNEGAVKYIAPGDISAGTVIEYIANAADFVDDNDPIVGTYGFSLAIAGDQVFAFQGASDSPSFVYAVQTNSTEWQTGVDDSNQSDLPLGLTNGLTAVAVGAGSGVEDEYDNAVYGLSITSGTQAELLAAISDVARWDGNNDPVSMPSGSFTVENTSDLTIEKTGLGAVQAGEELVYEITVSNTDIQTATNVVVTDTLPLSVTYVSDNSGVVPSNPTSLEYVWVLGDILSNTQVSFNLTVTVSADVVNGSVLTNTATVTTTAVGDDLANNEVAHYATVYSLVPIYAIQYVNDPGTDDVSPFDGEIVIVKGIVYAVYSYGYFIADAAGPWNGIYVYNNLIPNIGDEVQVTGIVTEYDGLTEIGSVLFQKVLSTGNELYDPIVVTTAEAPYDDIGTSEAYESVFVELNDITVLTENDIHNQWTFTDSGNDMSKVDDWGYNANPVAGDRINTLRGALVYHINEYKVLPRDSNDVVPLGVFITKMAETAVQVGDLLTYTITVENETGEELQDVTFVDFVPDMTTLVAVLDGGAAHDGTMLTWEFASLSDHDSVTVRFVVEALNYPGQTIVNDQYYVEATNWEPPVYGDPVLTFIGEYVPITKIQGSDFRSPFEGLSVTTRGEVIGFFEGNSPIHPPEDVFDGFFIQDPIGDGNTATSDAIFVNHGALDIVSLEIGDMVEVMGVIGEFNEYDSDACQGIECLTQVSVSNAENIITLTNSMRSLQAVTPIELDPPGDPAASDVYYEALEGMLVTLPDAGIVVGPTNYGAVQIIREDLGVDRVLRAGPYEGMPVGLRNWKYRGKIEGDDAPNLITGSTVVNVDGPLNFSYGDYMVITQEGDEWQVATEVLLPETVPSWPDADIDQFSVATFNTYEFDSEATNSKRKKVVDSIAQLNGAAFIALQEIEGDNAAFMTVLMADLAAAGFDYDYAFSHPDTGGHGVALLWNTIIVTDVTWSAAYQSCSPFGSSNSTAYDDYCDALPGEYPTFSRRPVVLTGTVQLDNSKQPVVVIANHLKSKLGGEPSDLRRLAQATFINELVADFIENRFENVIVMGDLNDFEDSPTLAAMYANDVLTNTWFTYSADRYTYIYEGVSQILDHILVTPAVNQWFESMGPLHINADYPYKPYATDSNVVWRTSDHDLVAATLAPPALSVDFTSNSPILILETAVFTSLAVGSSPISYEWDFGDGTPKSTNENPTHLYTDPGTYTVTLKATNPSGTQTIIHEFVVEPVVVNLPLIFKP